MGAVVLLLALWLSAGAASAGEPASVAASAEHLALLLRRAQEQDVAASAQWLRLGHWRTGLLGTRSEADGENFFLSPDGPRDPQSELRATLEAFFEPGAEETAAEDPKLPFAHAICRFPARFIFLRKVLDIDLTMLAVPRCQRFSDFYQDLDPESATLVFSSYYLNNPSSAFGHTFLRINKRSGGGLGKRKELLDYGIDFSATVDTDNALIYTFKGLFGFFPGSFHRLPYYYKVRQYGDFESRDLWAYELNLTTEQLEILVAHLWELGSTYFDYYYFTENCSYHIIGVLAAAAPDVGLMDRMRTPVIPADTVKVVVQTPGLVREVDYRPSLRTQFEARTAGLDAEQRERVAALAANPEAVLAPEWSPERAIATLDAAADLVDLRHAKELLRKTDPGVAERKRRLLERRSEIRSPSPVLQVAEPSDKMPQVAHGSRRLGLGPSLANGSKALAVGFRMSLHDLADPSDGYPELSQIEMGALRFRITDESNARFILDDFAAVRILSINPIDRFTRLPSWTVSLGARSVRDSGGCRDCLAASGRFGAGLAGAWHDEAVALFGRIDARAEAGALEGIADGPVRAGFGPAGGLRWRIDRRLVFLATGEWLYHPGQHPRSLWQTDAILRWGLRRNWALSLESSAQHEERRAELLLYLYL